MPTDPAIAAWFASEVQTHEPMLRAWLRSQYPGRTSEIDDVVQEAFVRIIRMHEKNAVRSPKAVLFVIARNLVLMQVRHESVARSTSLAAFDSSGILDEGTDIPHAVARAQELDMLTKAIQALPTRCRQVMTLRKLYGLSVADTAKELGMAEQTVLIHTGIGLRKISEYFQEHGLAPRKS